LYVGFTSDSVTNTGINFGMQDNGADAIAADFLGGVTGVAAVPASAANLTAGSATSKNKLSTATATYDLGMAKVGFNQTKMAVGAEFLKTSMTSVSVPLGATTVFYSASTGDGLATSGTYAAVLNSFSLKGTQYGANYALSKRTVAYVHAGRTTLDASNATIGGVATALIKKINNYGIGIHHSF
jgi:predicted porin